MKEGTLQSYKERILRVLVHIQQNLDSDLGLDDLARVACFSSYHFHRVFKGLVGESLQEHIRRLRLERAAMRLKSSVTPVVEIALEANYETHESFIRAFRTMFGEVPSRFRSSRKGLAFPDVPSRVHYRAGSVRSFVSNRTGGAKMNVSLREVQPMSAIFVRHTGHYSECGQAWDRLLTWAGARGLLGPGVRFIGICHDDPEVTPPERLRYDACVTVGDIAGVEDDVGRQVIGGGLYAMATHVGPYDRLGEIYARLCGEWVPRSGYELRSAPCLEEYLNSPESTAPEDLITDIYIPLESPGRRQL